MTLWSYFHHSDEAQVFLLHSYLFLNSLQTVFLSCFQLSHFLFVITTVILHRLQCWASDRWQKSFSVNGEQYAHTDLFVH